MINLDRFINIIYNNEKLLIWTAITKFLGARNGKNVDYSFKSQYRLKLKLFLLEF